MLHEGAAGKGEELPGSRLDVLRRKLGYISSISKLHLAARLNQNRPRSHGSHIRAAAPTEDLDGIVAQHVDLHAMARPTSGARRRRVLV